MSGGTVGGNTASSLSSSYGGGVHVEGEVFSMSGGTVSGNILSGTNGYGREVYLLYGTFKISGDAWPERIFFGNDYCSVIISGPLISPVTPIAVDLGLSGSAPLTVWVNKPILALDNTYNSGDIASLKNYFTLGKSKRIHSPYAEAPITGYMINDGGLFVSDELPPPPPPTLPSYNISNIAYSSVTGDPWTLEFDGRHKSPAISDDSITKEQVSFTSTSANALITIQLDVSSEENYDYAFISTLDNASATYSSGYFTGSRISGETSVTISIPVPTAGSHFVDICYQKSSAYGNVSDCAWFKIIE
jgi:hypothetical protein